VVGATATIYFLARRDDGVLIGGQDALFTIDPATGIATQYGAIALRNIHGAQHWYEGWTARGAGCNGAGGPVALGVSGVLRPGGSIVSTSNAHAGGSLGALIVGFDPLRAGNSPLPLLLDPLLGTSGCRLYTSIDFVQLGSATGPTPAQLTFTVPLPALGGFAVQMQHAAWEPVPGGMSWSNAVAVRVAY
jgi:hypothetical protein